MSAQQTSIQFFGGPLDGQRTATAEVPPPLFTVETILLRPQLGWMRRWIYTIFRNPHRSRELKVIATYRLDRRVDSVGYVHLTSRHGDTSSSQIRRISEASLFMLDSINR